MRLLLTSFFAVVLPFTAIAWGTTGHQVVADVAERHLDPKARTTIAQLLEGATMADVSTWLDQVRRTAAYRHTSDWHWVTIPDGRTYTNSERNPKGDVVEAIGRMKDILAADTATHEDKRFALKCLIHLVGDLHQPLHVGNGLDKGGNELQLRWGNRGSNLHKVWDSGIVDMMCKGREDLLAQLGSAGGRQLKAWRIGTHADWAQECVVLRPSIYTVKAGDTIGEAYARTHWPVVREQLHKAGVRPAMLLNEALG